MANARSTSNFAAVAAVSLLASCQALHRSADLAHNPAIYQPVGFTSKTPGDRPVFVTPLADARRFDVLPAAQGGWPIVYDDDSKWARPVRDMVSDVLHDELGDSAIFAGLAGRAEPAALVLKPSLVVFASGSMESDEGGRSMAEVGIRVQVYGAEEDGKRPLLHDQMYSDRQMSTVAMLPMSSFIIAGRALRTTVARLVSGLDGSNVSRSGVPLDFDPSGGTRPAVPAAPVPTPPAAPGR